MKKQFIYGLLSLTVLSGAGLSSCSSEEDFGGPKGQRVLLTVNASKDAQTRTAFEEKDGDLLCTWTEGDQLLVTDRAGQRLGVISLVEGAGNATALFKGEVTLDGNETVNLFYLGNGKEIPATLSGDSYVIDLSAQDGSFASLAANDFMAQEVNVTLLNGEASGSAEMMRYVAEGRFDLQLPDGVQLEAGDVITISQPDGKFQTTRKVKYATTGTVANQTNGTLTITKAEAGNDIYVTILPQTLTPTFTVKKDGYCYTAVLGSHVWSQETFVRNEDGSGVPVAEWTKTDLPVDPGNTDNWGDGSITIDAGYITGTPKFVSENDGWTVNVRSVYNYGGFGTYVTYTHNGMMNGLLTSKGGTAFYYQWGRWLGFPSTCGRTVINSGGSASGSYPVESQYLNGVNIYNTNVGYIFDSGLVCSYAACYMGNTSWTRVRALRSSIIFGMVNSMSTGPLDYIGANESCKWEDRCGNPAPDGYRIPTASELETLIPAAKTINGSLKELKVVNGTKYAMLWKVVTSGSVPYVEIRSVEVASSVTDANTVADAEFSDANPVRFAAYGFMNNEAELQQRGSYGVYWSSETGTNAISGTTGFGGKCLEIDFSGSKATMGMTVAPRSFGIPVLLIKDNKAKASSIEPWFPVTLQH